MLHILITSKESKDSIGNVKTIVESIETIKENAYGFTQELELLTNLDNLDGKRMVFVYCREIKN